MLGRSTPDYIAIVGRDGIAMAAQGCNNPTTLGLDHAAFIDAVVGACSGAMLSWKVGSITLTFADRWGSTSRNVSRGIVSETKFTPGEIAGSPDLRLPLGSY